jgi:4-amino-4-deoxy-L-arabinose transferase-like glycosyltransferase
VWLPRERWLLAAILLFTALVRGGVLWGTRANLEQDPDMYREIAENLLVHGEFARGWGESVQPTAYRPPLYPIVLSNLPDTSGRQVALWKVAILHVLLGVATVWLTYLTARRLIGSSKVGPSRREGQDCELTPRSQWLAKLAEYGHALAAMLVACDPILLNQQTLVMTETIATFLAILALWSLVRFSERKDWWNAALAGGVLGLAALSRPTFLPWLGLVGIGVALTDCGLRLSDWRKHIGRNAANFAALAITAAVIVAPWGIRNYREFGKPILTTTHGGYTLLLGNNPGFYEWLRSSDNRSEIPFDATVLPLGSSRGESPTTSVTTPNPAKATFPDVEVSEDIANYYFARYSIRQDPSSFVLACVYRIRQLWSLLPNKLTADESTGRRLLRYATAAWYLGVYSLAVVGLWRLRWRVFQQPWVWGLLLCFVFTAVHTFYWSNLRMRAPLMPFIALVAAAACLASGSRTPSGPEEPVSGRVV